MTYATDSEFVARVPTVASLSAAQRKVALDDAMPFIDLRNYRGLALRAHVAMAAHLLALDGLIDGGGEGLVTSRSAAEISVSYAATALSPDDSLLATTRYGRQFLMIRDMVPHSPEAV